MINSPSVERRKLRLVFGVLGLNRQIFKAGNKSLGLTFGGSTSWIHNLICWEISTNLQSQISMISKMWETPSESLANYFPLKNGSRQVRPWCYKRLFFLSCQLSFFFGFPSWKKLFVRRPLALLLLLLPMLLLLLASWDMSHSSQAPGPLDCASNNYFCFVTDELQFFFCFAACNLGCNSGWQLRFLPNRKRLLIATDVFGEKKKQISRHFLFLLGNYRRETTRLIWAAKEKKEEIESFLLFLFKVVRLPILKGSFVIMVLSANAKCLTKFYRFHSLT